MMNTSDWFQCYSDAVRATINNLDEQSKNNIEDFYESVVSFPSIPLLFAGNGGSAAVAEHAVTDFGKGLRDVFPLSVHSLVSNSAYLTASGNDNGYENTLIDQYSNFEQIGGNVVIISSSGNSENVCKLLDRCISNDVYTTCIVGFDGGELLKTCKEFDLNFIHFHNFNYGVVEDCSMMVLHSVFQKIKNEATLRLLDTRAQNEH
jgi:D-sedoheptulose 7-phosphate isomerase